MPNKRREDTPQSFILEQIKDRPVDRKKLVQKTLGTLALAFFFGLVASLAFWIVGPLASRLMSQSREPELVYLEEGEAVENLPQTTEPVLGESLAPEEALWPEKLDLAHQRQLYGALSAFVEERKASLVEIYHPEAHSSGLHLGEEKPAGHSGIVLANNGLELLLLADTSLLEESGLYIARFSTGEEAPATRKKTDNQTQLSVLAVNLEDLDSQSLVDRIVPVEWANSHIPVLPGTPVVALGSPLGMVGSLGYGVVSYREDLAMADTALSYLIMDIHVGLPPTGALFNLQGQLLGILTHGKKTGDLRQFLGAYGIAEIKKRVEALANGKNLPYLGIRGESVSKQANRMQGVPEGVFVSHVDMESPAMLVGIQKGDVLVAADGKPFASWEEYVAWLLEQNPGQEVELTVQRQVQGVYRGLSLSVEIGTNSY